MCPRARLPCSMTAPRACTRARAPRPCRSESRRQQPSRRGDGLPAVRVARFAHAALSTALLASLLPAFPSALLAARPCRAPLPDSEPAALACWVARKASSLVVRPRGEAQRRPRVEDGSLRLVRILLGLASARLSERVHDALSAREAASLSAGGSRRDSVSGTPPRRGG
jgi:hypothetical protein